MTVNFDGMNRIQPNLPAWAYKTYQVVSPIRTHFRDATCDEVECPAHEKGWVTKVDEFTELGQRQAHYIRKLSDRHFAESKSPEGLTEFTFSAGQKCFTAHKVRLDREEHFYLRGGDWRGNPTGTTPRKFDRADQFIDDFGEHQERLRDQIERG